MGGRALTGAMEIVAFGALVCFLFAISSFLVLPTPAYAQSNSPPQFSDFRNNRTAAENLPIGSPVGDPVTATDADNDTLTYSLHGRDSASFAIDSSTGQLRTKAALDYERKNRYSVTVRANDGTTEGNAITTIAVTINVTNKDDLGTVTLSPARTRVGASLTATLSDPDGGVRSVTWSWGNATTATGPFSPISGATSASYTPVAGDLGKYLRATASYTDGHGSNKTSQGVSDNVVQPNAAPDFGASTATRSVAENTPAGRNIGAAVAVTDADGDTLTYSLSGTDAASFAIAASTGQLRTSTTLDYETKNGYTVTVTATDTASASDTITVTDVPDVPLAASLNNLEMVKLLLGAGAEVHIFDNRRYTPLHNAVYNPDLEVAGFLLDNGAQLHVAGAQGETPLASAMFPGRGEMVELLLDRGADIRWAPEEEWTLHT